MKFENQSLAKRMKSMIAVDLRRTFTSRLFYIMAGISLVMPILILVMTTMMDGTVSVDPTTGAETVIEGFDNVWQAIGTPSTAPMGGMELTSMCNINLIYIVAGIYLCLFVSEDFRSGFSKNLFTTRPTKIEYVASKTVTGFICGAVMLVLYFIGAMLGGMISSLPFGLDGISAGNVFACMLSKVFLMLVFISIFLIVSVAAKHRTWLCVVGSLGASMLLFTMIPMMTPLDAGAINVIMTLVGGALFALGLGAASNLILKKTSLV